MKSNKRRDYSALRKLVVQTISDCQPQFCRDIANILGEYVQGTFECACHTDATPAQQTGILTTNCSYVKCGSDSTCGKFTCHSSMCQHCVTVCHCGKNFCSDCASKKLTRCSTCSNPICYACNENMTCGECSKRACETQFCCVRNCPRRICNDCSHVCDACSGRSCSRCDSFGCRKCNRFFCEECCDSKICNECGFAVEFAHHLDDPCTRETKGWLCLSCADRCNLCNVVFDFRCMDTRCKRVVNNENLSIWCIKCDKHVCTNCRDGATSECKKCAIGTNQRPMKKAKH